MSTSCSSARPTCRTASAFPVASTIRGYLAALERVTTAAEAAGKAAGILLRTASALPQHRDLGFRFIGLGSDGAFISDGARAVLDAARELTPPAAASRSPRRSPLFVGHAHRQRRRPLGRRPGLGHHDPDEDQRATHELDRRQGHLEQDRRQRDRPDRLRGGDQRRMRRADAQGSA